MNGVTSAADDDVTRLLGEGALTALQQPTASARGLPGRAYADPAMLDLERRRLFARTWVAAAAVHEVASPGDVLPVDVAGWPLLLVRGRDGVLRAFHNICRHRGMAVVAARCSNALTLRCPWHGWTYDLAGRLMGTPEFGGVGVHQVPELEREAHGLKPVRVGEWLDLVFVDIGGEAPALDEHLASFQQRFKAWDFGTFRHSGTWEHVYECNWKIAVEGAIEDYHLCWLHPQITNGAKRADECFVETDGHTWYAVSGRMAQATVQRRGAGRGQALPMLRDLPDEEARSIYFCSIFPSAVIGFDRSHMYLGTWLPEGVARTRLRFHLYFVGDEGATGERYEVTRRRYAEAVRAVFAQDEPVVAAVQQRAQVRDELGIVTRFSPFWETAVHAFQCQVVRCLRAA